MHKETKTHILSNPPPPQDPTRTHIQTGVVLLIGSLSVPFLPVPFLELIDKLLCALRGIGLSKSNVTNSCSCWMLGE